MFDFPFKPVFRIHDSPFSCGIKCLAIFTEFLLKATENRDGTPPLIHNRSPCACIVFRIRTCGSHETVEEHAAAFELLFFGLGCHPQKPYPYNLSGTVKTGHGHIAIVAGGLESYPALFEAYVGYEFLFCILWVEFLCPYPVGFGDTFNLFA